MNKKYLYCLNACDRMKEILYRIRAVFRKTAGEGAENNCSIERNIMKKKFNPIAILIILITIIFLGIISTFSASSLLENVKKTNVSEYNNGWNFLYGGKQEEVKEIPTKQIVKRGRKYRIQNRLPEVLDTDTVLALCLLRQEAEIYIDGEKRTEYNNHSIHFFKTMPLSKVIFIPLEEQDSGKIIEIVLKSYNITYSGRINEMYYGPSMACVLSTLSYQMPIFCLYFLFACISVLLILIFCFIRKKKRRYLEILGLGIVTLDLTVSVAMNYNILQLVVQNDRYINLLGFISTIFLPFAYIAYFIHQAGKKEVKKVMVPFAYFFLAFIIFILFSQVKQMIDLGFILELYTICTIIMFICSIALLLIEICTEYTYSKIPLFLALHILLFTVVVEIFSCFQNVVSSRNSGVFFGAGIFACLIILGTVSTNNVIKTFEENQRNREEILQNRVDLMIHQIQPHFIYNTLNSIQALIDIDAQKASKMIYDFSRYLRVHIDTMEMEGMISFKEELENITAYVEIEKVRFPKIKVHYEIKEYNFLIPALSIQPIVENAIRHGISKKINGGNVWIRSVKMHEKIVIEIKDDGVGIKTINPLTDSDESNKKRSVGLKNITYRLNKICNAVVQCTSEMGVGTTVTIELPEMRGETNENYFS